MKSSYYVFFPVRNCEESIEKVMDSLINQSYPPEKICVVDDGSTDKTGDILLKFQKAYADKIKVFQTKSITRDYKRIPSLLNMCLDKKYDYHMTAAGDSIFEVDYAKKILLELENDPQIVVASGYYTEVKQRVPEGSGRFVKQDYFFKFYDEYPEIVGYESEIFIKAQINGYKIYVSKDAKFNHVDRIGHKHNFIEFGMGMRALGYHPFAVLVRVLREFLKNDVIGRRGTCNMFWSYLAFKPDKTGYYSLFPKEDRKQIREFQKQRIKAKFLKFFGK